MDIIKKKIEELNTEATNIVTVRDQLNRQLAEMQIRLSHIVGAVKVLDEVLEDSINKSEDNDESQEDRSMKKQELYGLQQTLQSMKDVKSTKFAYAIIKNLKIIDKELKALQDAQKQPDGMIEFEKARMALCTNMCKKDEQGSPVIEDNNFVIEDMEAFEKSMEDLKEEHKAVFDAQKEQQENMMKLLQEETEIKLHVVKEEFLPDDLSANQLEALDAIIA